jgi:hypothetical protein
MRNFNPGNVRYGSVASTIKANGFAGCPLCSESDLNDASQRNDALCYKQTF